MTSAPASLRSTPAAFTGRPRIDLDWLANSAIVVQDSPETVTVGLGSLRRHARPLEGRTAFYLPDFYLRDPEPWWSAEEVVTMPAEALRGLLEERLARAPTPPPLRWSAPEAEPFLAATRRILRRIEERAVDKAIPVGVESASLAEEPEGRGLGARLLPMLARALAAPRPLRAYGAWRASEEGPAARGILGATPEILFELTADGEVRTHALAGTRELVEGASHEALGAELLADPKEAREHAFVVEDLERVLAAIAGSRGELRVGPRTVLALPGLLHLRTELSARPEAPPDLESLALCLHPTPALGVAPRERGLGWLEAHDGVRDRARFGAPFGLRRPDGSGLCLVAIRNVQWDPARARVLAGCGIVEGSEPEREWGESCAKRRSLKRLLGL